MTNVIMRRVPEDLPAIVVLLANDALESTREDALIPLRSSYVEGFTAIDADPNQFLVVAALDAKVVRLYSSHSYRTSLIRARGAPRSKLCGFMKICAEAAVDGISFNGHSTRLPSAGVSWFNSHVIGRAPMRTVSIKL